MGPRDQCQLSPTNSGLLLLLLMMGAISASVASGRLISRTGRYKIFPLMGTTLIASGLWLLSTLGPTSTLTQVSADMLALGVGMGLTMQVLVIVVQNAVAAPDLRVATSSATFFRSLGGSFGTALFGAILAGRLAGIERLLPVGIGVDNLTASPELIAQLPDALRIQIIETFSNAITASFVIAFPIALIALALVLAIPELSLRDTARVTETI